MYVFHWSGKLKLENKTFIYVYVFHWSGKLKLENKTFIYVYIYSIGAVY